MTFLPLDEAIADPKSPTTDWGHHVGSSSGLINDLVYITDLANLDQFSTIPCLRLLPEQGHHHNGDQAVRRPRVICSIRGRRFVTLGLVYIEVGDGLI